MTLYSVPPDGEVIPEHVALDLERLELLKEQLEEVRAEITHLQNTLAAQIRKSAYLDLPDGRRFKATVRRGYTETYDAEAIRIHLPELYESLTKRVPDKAAITKALAASYIDPEVARLIGTVTENNAAIVFTLIPQDVPDAAQ